MSEEWTDWEAHDGGDCPLSCGQVAQVRKRCGCVSVPFVVGSSQTLLKWWSYLGPCRCQECGAVLNDFAITHFRIRKPRGLTLLEQIADLKTQPSEPEVVS